MPPSKGWDLFISHRSTEKAAIAALREALVARGVQIFVDDTEIDDFDPEIGRRIAMGLGRCRALLAWATPAWRRSRACQWELRTAAAASLALGEPLASRLLMVCPAGAIDTLPGSLRGARAWTDADDASGLADAVVRHLATLSDAPLTAAEKTWKPRCLGWSGTASNRFVGRFEEIWRLLELLEGRGAAEETGRKSFEHAQIRGLGGVGKTLLAMEFGLAFAAMWPGGIVWLRPAGERGDPMAAFSLLLAELGAAAPPWPEWIAPEQRRAVYLSQLRTSVAKALGAEAVLWIVDDLPSSLDWKEVESWLCPVPGGRTLITTRSRSWEALGGVLDLGSLPTAEALQLLLTRIEVRRDISAEEHRSGAAIVSELGGHALAVDVAAALADRRGLQEVQQLIEAPTLEPLDALAAELKEQLPGGHARQITATLIASLQLLPAAGWDLLRACAWLAPQQVPKGLPEAALRSSRVAPPSETEVFAGAESVRGESLAEVNEVGWSVHSLVRRIVIAHHPDPARAEALGAALEQIFETGMPERVTNVHRHREVAMVVPHAIALARARGGAKRLLAYPLRYHAVRGEFATGAVIAEEMFKAQCEHLGEEDPETMTSQVSLAICREREGLRGEGRRLHQRALELRRRVLGDEHPDTWQSVAAVASCLEHDGELRVALEMRQSLVATIRRHRGDAHLDTLEAMSALARTHATNGDFRASSALHETVVAGLRDTLGNDHLRTVNEMMALVNALTRQGDMSSASVWRDLAARAFNEGNVTLPDELVLARKEFVPQKDEALDEMHELGVQCYHQGQWEEAAGIHYEVLAQRRRLLGDAHPETLSSLNMLGASWMQAGDFGDALPLLEEGLQAAMRTLGPEHPDTQVLRMNLATVQRGAARHTERSASVALPGETKALELLTCRELGSAQRSFETLIPQLRKALGAEHPRVLTAASNLASTHLQQGNAAAAAQGFREVLNVRRRRLPPGHPDLIKVLMNLAAALWTAGDIGGAREVNAELLPMQRKALGDDHPMTIVSAWNAWASVINQADPLLVDVLSILNRLEDTDPASIRSPEVLEVRLSFVEVKERQSREA